MTWRDWVGVGLWVFVLGSTAATIVAWALVPERFWCD